MRILAADDDLVSRLAMEDVLRQCGAPEVTLVSFALSMAHFSDPSGCFSRCIDR